jgi:predicted naringenin-chalcone synthase
LPDGVLKELKNNTPKSQAGNYTARFFQSLTPDVGNPHLTAQIQQMVTLFMLSDNMKDMWSKFEKLRVRQAGQMELPFEFDNEGHTIEPNEKIYKEKELSNFNKNLKKALDFKPKKS